MKWQRERTKKEKNQRLYQDFNVGWLVLGSQEEEWDLWEKKFSFGYVDFDLLMGYPVGNNWKRTGTRNI